MFKKTLTTLVAASVVASISAVAADKLNGAGASFPANVYYAWAKSYQDATQNQINYQAIGSGGGVKQMKAKTVDFGGTDEALQPEELGKYKILQFPTVVGAIVLAYNLDGIKDGELKLSNEVVEGIFMGEIQKWNDPKIAKENAGLKLPDEKITVVHRSDGSGTTFNFTVWINGISKKWAEKVGKGKAVAWPTGIGGKGNEGVTNLIKQTPGSVGYIELSYKNEMGLTAASVQSSTGKWVEATPATVANAAAYAKWKPEEGFYIELASQPGDQTYPIVAGTFVMMHADKPDMSKKVVAFYDWSFKNGDKIAGDLGFISLPDATKEMIRKYWKDNGIY